MAERHDPWFGLLYLKPCFITLNVAHVGLKVAPHPKEDPETALCRIYSDFIGKSKNMTVHFGTFLPIRFGFGFIIS